MERTIPKRVMAEKMIKVSLLIPAKAANLVIRRTPMAEENKVVMKMTAKKPFINCDFSEVCIDLDPLFQTYDKTLIFFVKWAEMRSLTFVKYLKI
jgi:hypothetical protein